MAKTKFEYSRLIEKMKLLFDEMDFVAPQRQSVAEVVRKDLLDFHEYIITITKERLNSLRLTPKRRKLSYTIRDCKRDIKRHTLFIEYIRGLK